MLQEIGCKLNRHAYLQIGGCRRGDGSPKDQIKRGMGPGLNGLMPLLLAVERPILLLAGEPCSGRAG